MLTMLTILTTTDEYNLEELGINCSMIALKTKELETDFVKLEKLKELVKEKRSIFIGPSHQDIEEFICEFTVYENGLNQLLHLKHETLALYTTLSTRIAELLIQRTLFQKKLDELSMKINQNQDEFQKLSLLDEQDCMRKNIKAFGDYVERSDGVLKNVLSILVDSPKGDLSIMAKEVGLVKPIYTIKSSIVPVDIIEYITIFVCIAITYLAFE